MSPAVQQLCRSVFINDNFSDRSSVSVELELASTSPTCFVWPQPSQIPWDQVDEEAWQQACWNQSFDAHDDSTQFYSYFAAHYEESLTGHISSNEGKLHPSHCGRASRLEPIKQAQTPMTIKASRPGELQLRTDFVGKAVILWFRQTRRIQSFLRAIAAGKMNPSAVLYRIELWQAILHAQGFKGGFRDWWLQEGLAELLGPLYPLCHPLWSKPNGSMQDFMLRSEDSKTGACARRANWSKRNTTRPLRPLSKIYVKPSLIKLIPGCGCPSWIPGCFAGSTYWSSSWRAMVCEWMSGSYQGLHRRNDCLWDMAWNRDRLHLDSTVTHHLWWPGAPTTSFSLENTLATTTWRWCFHFGSGHQLCTEFCSSFWFWLTRCQTSAAVSFCDPFEVRQEDPMDLLARTSLRCRFAMYRFCSSSSCKLSRRLETGRIRWLWALFWRWPNILMHILLMPIGPSFFSLWFIEYGHPCVAGNYFGWLNRAYMIMPMGSYQVERPCRAGFPSRPVLRWRYNRDKGFVDWPPTWRKLSFRDLNGSVLPDDLDFLRGFWIHGPGSSGSFSEDFRFMAISAKPSHETLVWPKVIPWVSLALIDWRLRIYMDALAPPLKTYTFVDNISMLSKDASHLALGFFALRAFLQLWGRTFPSPMLGAPLPISDLFWLNLDCASSVMQVNLVVRCLSPFGFLACSPAW